MPLQLLYVILELASLATAASVDRRDSAPNGWSYKGCYSDSTSDRVLDGFAFPSSSMEQEWCMQICNDRGFTLAGVEYGDECYCDYNLDSSSSKQLETDCYMACAGNSTEKCGGPNRLSLFASPNLAPSFNPGPGGWTYLGCYQDSVNSRVLPVSEGVPGGSSNMTVAACTSTCQKYGYRFAGVEFGQECYCADSFTSSQTSTACRKPCTGNATEYCGGPSALNVYQAASNAPGGSSLPAGWSPLGCFTDNVYTRTLQTAMGIPGGGANMSIEACLSVCQASSYSLAGVEYSQECYCGFELDHGGLCASDQTTCDMHCAGNLKEVCGGPNRLNLYQFGSGSVASCSTLASTSSVSTTQTSSTTSPATSTVADTPTLSTASMSSTSVASSTTLTTTTSPLSTTTTVITSTTSTSTSVSASAYTIPFSTPTCASATPTQCSGYSAPTTCSGYFKNGDFEKGYLTNDWSLSNPQGMNYIASTVSNNGMSISGCYQLVFYPYNKGNSFYKAGHASQIDLYQYPQIQYGHSYLLSFYQGWANTTNQNAAPIINVTTFNQYPLWKGSACSGSQCNLISPGGYGYQKVSIPFVANQSIGVYPPGGYTTFVFDITWTGDDPTDTPSNGLLIDGISLIDQ